MRARVMAALAAWILAGGLTAWAGTTLPATSTVKAPPRLAGKTTVKKTETPPAKETVSNPDQKVFDIPALKQLQASVEYADADLANPIKPKVIILLDSSGSMGQLLDRQHSKMFFAKKLFGEYLRYQWREKAEVGMVVYGSRRKEDCDDTYLAIQPGERNLSKIDDTVKKLAPTGMTPIANSLEIAINQLRGYPGPKRIMIFTDGEETCGGDSCEILQKAIQEKVVDLEMFVTGIGLSEKSKDLDKLRCLGKTFGAQSPQQLSQALQDISNEIGLGGNKDHKGPNLLVEAPDPKVTVKLYELKNGERVYVRDFVAANGVTIPPGTYSADVMLDPVYAFKEFTIPPKKKVVLKVQGSGILEVKFFKGLLDVEILNKDKKVIQSFSSDEPAVVKSGVYDIRISAPPFFEFVSKKYKIIPGARHDLAMDTIGIVQINYPSNIGIHVIDGNGKPIGNYLTNFPFVLPVGTYRFFVADKCDIPGITVRNEKQIQVLQCLKR